MRENDIAVSLNALDSIDKKLYRTMSELQQFAAQLNRNMMVASKDFDSANFERAQAIVSSVMQKLNAASERLDGARMFLKELLDKAEFYLKCKYLG